MCKGNHTAFQYSAASFRREDDRTNDTHDETDEEDWKVLVLQHVLPSRASIISKMTQSDAVQFYTNNHSGSNIHDDLFSLEDADKSESGSESEPDLHYDESLFEGKVAYDSDEDQDNEGIELHNLIDTGVDGYITPSKENESEVQSIDAQLQGDGHQDRCQTDLDIHMPDPYVPRIDVYQQNSTPRSAQFFEKLEAAFLIPTNNAKMGESHSRIQDLLGKSIHTTLKHITNAGDRGPAQAREGRNQKDSAQRAQ